MNKPFSLVIPEIDRYIIDAEKISPNFYRISIDKVNFNNAIKIIHQYDFNLRSILSHSVSNEKTNKFELQYIFCKLHDNRDYQLLVCLYVLNRQEFKSFKSISKYFQNAKPMEEKLTKDLP
ncbi:MAG: hypothetical protein ACW981_12435 [Candidatus Hodarchaeales archaeon]|jgi:Ni,Fe-hydrogenase III component G